MRGRSDRPAAAAITGKRAIRFILVVISFDRPDYCWLIRAGLPERLRDIRRRKHPRCDCNRFSRRRNSRTAFSVRCRGSPLGGGEQPAASVLLSRLDLWSNQPNMVYTRGVADVY